MTTEQEIQLFKEIREMKEMIQQLSGKQDPHKVPAAAKILNVGAAWLRERCKEGLPGTYPINENSRKVQYNVDVIEAGKAIKNLIHQQRRGPRKKSKYGNAS